MNFFSKNKLIFWVLIFLVTVNLTALVTIGILYSRYNKLVENQSVEKPTMAFQRELDLTPSQSEKVDVILEEFRNSTDSVRNRMRESRAALLEELARENPDTNHIFELTGTISLLQRHMQNASAKQYLALKKICNPDQCKRLSDLYFEFYGFQGKGPGMGRGEGKMRQYRGGQGGGHGRGNRMGRDSGNK